MSILQETQTHTSGVLTSLTQAALNFVARLWRNWRHRLAVAKLADLDDYALRDIGLIRHDVQSALSVPMLDDPSARLSALANERWHAERATRGDRLRGAQIPRTGH